MNKILLFFLAFFAIQTSTVFSKVFYVAVNGVDSDPGTFDLPLATIQKAQEYVSAGDTVYIRGGNYVMTEAQIAKYVSIWAYVINLDKSGSSGKRINYWAYPGETPVFDFSNIKPVDLRVIAFFVSGSWIHLKGIDVTGVQVTILTHTQSECFENQGSNNIYEQINMYDSQAIGIYCLKGSNNLFLNCDAYRNWDYTSEGGRGGNVDGFGCHTPKGQGGNIFRGCRAWFNSDDGFDCINEGEPVIFDNCWAFYNGYSTSFASLGDGNGFKAGGYGSTAFDKLPIPIPSNTVRFCLAVRNKAGGFYSNHHLAGSYWYNNTAYKNATNYNMLNRDSVTPTGYLRDVDGYDHVMKNNLGYMARSKELDKINKPRCILENNYFDLTVVVTNSDFVSLDENLLIQPRMADGSLPDIDFMKLTSTSNLIDKGVDIGFAYYGQAPDLGAFEYSSTPTLITENSNKSGILVSCYPNPAKNNVTISFELASQSLVKINMVNILGKLVKTIANQYYSSGQNNIDFIISVVNPGIYFLEINIGNSTINKPLLIN